MKDKEIELLIAEELERQRNTIELIASENIVSSDVLKAAGSVLTNKYAEGRYPSRDEWDNCLSNQSYKSLRYYNGCDIIDKVELLACQRFQKLFNTDYHVNVQPHSGAQANMATFEALLKQGDTVLSMDLSNGGHLSHGSSVNYSGKHYTIVSYGVNSQGEIDYNEVEKLALLYQPKLIICGASNYSKIINFPKFAEIRDKVIKKKEEYKEYIGLESINTECYLMADIAHIAGLIAGGQHPSPFGYADVVTTTTHKSLRGPRGGVIACLEKFAKRIDSAVFPGTQGGPLEHIIAAKAVCFHEALQPEFKEYASQIVKNAKVLSEALIEYGIPIVGGTTENHVMTIDLRSLDKTGKDMTNVLERVGITANKNTVPNDPQSPFVTSGIRLGTPAVTTRGFKEEDMESVAYIIAQAIFNSDNSEKLTLLKERSLQLCKKYSLYN